VRETLVRKGFGKADFERAARVLAEARARLLAYVLLKPLGLGEREAIEDAVASAAYVFEVAARCGVPTRVALQPTFVAPGTALEREMLEGRYEPPSLWSVVEVVRRAHGLGEIAVGMSDEGLEPRRAPAGCPHCTGPLREAIAQYNRTLRLEPLERAACECRGAGSRCGAPVL
jgi:radical SAM enzyme (TIGR01210 family)